MGKSDMPGGDDLTIVFSEETAARMAADPRMAAAIRSFCASMRQAAEAVKEGRYETMEDALEGITGRRPMLVAGMADNDN